ncbi:hypothetical protein ACFL0M_01020 [Thermodesulfobacteriota bacterium]
MSSKNGLTRFVLLGSGAPDPNPKRMGACVAVLVGGRPILIGCGRGGLARYLT